MQMSQAQPGTYDWLCCQMVEKSQDAIIYADREGIIRFWNTGAEAIFGYTLVEALGQSLDLIIPERLRPRHWEGYHRVMATGVTRYGRELLATPGLRKNGEPLSVEFTLTIIWGEDGRLKGAAAIVRDVTAKWTEIKALKRRLAELEKKAAPPSA
jgi:PAS domain S-box-containing protein